LYSHEHAIESPCFIAKSREITIDSHVCPFPRNHLFLPRSAEAFCGAASAVEQWLLLRQQEK
jgi:hypothetical protein